MQLVNILCVSQFIAVSLVHPVQQVKRVYNLCVSPLMAVCTQKVCCLVTSKVRSSCKEDKDLLSPALTQEEPSIRPMPCPSSAPTMHHCTSLFPEVSSMHPSSSSHKIKRQCGFTIYSMIDWMNNTITNNNKTFWMEHMFPSISDFTSGLKYEDLLLMPKFLHLCQMRSDKNYSVWLPNYWWWPKYASDSSCFTSGQFWILSLALVSTEIS